MTPDARGPDRNARRLPARAMLAATLLFAAACGRAPRYDVLIRGGTVVDGTGGAPFAGDVAIRDGYVVRVGDVGPVRADEVVDASGLYVTPGFVNLHSHDRLGAAPTAENLLGQGVTTIVLNADGGGPPDIVAQIEEAEARGLAVNVAPNVGFNTAWSIVNGWEDTRPSAAQLQEMHDLLEAGLEAGAWGVSAGLDYKPTYYATTDEVIEVLTGLDVWRTVFTNHDRLTPESGFSSRIGMRETIAVGEAVGLMPIFTHMKIQGREQGSHPEILGMMDEATGRGTYTAADVYPYLAGQTSLAALIIPGWAQAGGIDAMRARFGDPAQRARIVAEAEDALEARFGGPEGVFLPATQRELVDVMREMGVRSAGEAVVRILDEESPSAILRFGSEVDLAAILAHPTASIACDCDPARGRVGHPRAYGTFPRALGRYVRELGVLTWEEAIRKMTGLPAATVGFVDRGLLAPGMRADVVVFDPDEIIDRATYEEPTQPSVGVRHVYVNGRAAWRDGAATGVQAGKGLLRGRHMPARPQDSDGRRGVALAGTLTDAAGRTNPIEVRVAQTAGARVAAGELSIGPPGSELDLEVTAFGPLQTTEGWAALTGTARLGPDEEAAFVLVLDADDPDSEGEGTAVLLHVNGEEVVRGRTPVVPGTTP